MEPIAVAHKRELSPYARPVFVRLLCWALGIVARIELWALERGL